MPDLFVTDHTPTLGVGRALRVYAVIRALALSGPVDVLYVRFGADEPPLEYDIPGVTLHAVSSSHGARRALAVGAAVLAGTPPRVARSISPEVQQRVGELAPAPGTGRIIADGTGMFMGLRGFQRSHGVILNAHNLESSFQDQLGDARLGSEKQLARFERRLFRDAAETWMVSHADIEGTLALAPTARVRYVPNVVDVSAITPVDPPRTQVALLVADFTWPPNREAVRFLLEEVMEQVWRELPDTRLRLVGRGLELEPGTDPRVDAAGFVEDLRDAYDGAACVVVPLLTGGGSPLKFVEGLAHGLPVVATPLAAQGLDGVLADVHYREGDGAAAYAAALVEVLRDGADDVGAAGRAVAEERYSIETLAGLLGPGSAPVTTR